MTDSKTRIGAALFSDEYSLGVPFGEYEDANDLKIQIRNLSQLKGNTKTYNAIRHMREYFVKNGREGIYRIAIILTDGMSDNYEETVKEASLLQKQGVYVFAVGIGKGVNLKELSGICSDPEGKFMFTVANFDMLETIRERLAYSACRGKKNIYYIVMGGIILLVYVGDAWKIEESRVNL